MPKYIRVAADGSVVGSIDSGHALDCIGFGDTPKPVLLEVTSVTKPNIDPATQKLTGPTYTLRQFDADEVWAAVDKTAQEIDVDARATRRQLLASTDGKAMRILEEIYDVVAGNAADISPEAKATIAARKAARQGGL